MGDVERGRFSFRASTTSWTADRKGARPVRATGEGKRFLFGVRRANKIDDDDEAVHQEESSNLDGPAGFALKQKKK